MFFVFFVIQSRETSVSALFFMNVSSPSAPAMLPFQRPEQTNVYVTCAFEITACLSAESRKLKAKCVPLIQSLRCPPVPNKQTWLCSKTSLHGFARLHFFANSIMLLEKYTLKKKTGVSWYGMIFQCIVTILFV